MLHPVIIIETKFGHAGGRFKSVGENLQSSYFIKCIKRLLFEQFNLEHEYKVINGLSPQLNQLANINDDMRTAIKIQDEDCPICNLIVFRCNGGCKQMFNSGEQLVCIAEERPSLSNKYIDKHYHPKCYISTL